MHFWNSLLISNHVTSDKESNISLSSPIRASKMNNFLPYCNEVEFLIYASTISVNHCWVEWSKICIGVLIFIIYAEILFNWCTLRSAVDRGKVPISYVQVHVILEVQVTQALSWAAALLHAWWGWTTVPQTGAQRSSSASAQYCASWRWPRLIRGHGPTHMHALRGPRQLWACGSV